MADKTLSIAQILELLAAAPGRTKELSTGLTPVQLRSVPGPDAWSVNDVLAHLRACSDEWGKCIAAILAEENPTIRAVNPQAWIEQTDYPELEFQPSFEAYSRQRVDLLMVLEALGPEDWERTASVTGAGAVLIRTVFTYANRLARHERPHLKQIARIAAALRK